MKEGFSILNAAFEIHLSIQQLLRLLPMEICIFFNVHGQIIVDAKLPQKHLCKK